MAYPLLFQEKVFDMLHSFKRSGAFPHALIFEGSQGSGRKTAAQYAAMLLLCKNEDTAPCQGCSGCRKMAAKTHPDFSVLLPENKSKTISVEQVRSMKLSAFVSPHEAQRKVYFIPDAQHLRAEAQNALLKLIEEPPESAYFIMTVLSRSNLLDTVVSRSAVIAMQELSDEQKLAALEEKIPNADKGTRQQLCENSRTVGEAIAAFSDPIAQQLAENAKDFCEAVLAGARYKALRVLNSCEKDREGYLHLLDAVRSRIIMGLCLQNGELSALRAGQIIDIIDKTAFAARQNAALGLLSCAAVNKLIKAAAVV